MHAQCASVNAAVLDPVRGALKRLTRHLLDLIPPIRSGTKLQTDLEIEEATALSCTYKLGDGELFPTLLWSEFDD
jgi:hypothetical protein